MRTETRLFLHLCCIAFQFRCRKGTIPHSGDNLTQGLDADVTCRIDSVPACFLGSVRYDISLPVKVDESFDKGGFRFISDEDENTEGTAVLGGKGPLFPVTLF